MIEFTDLTLIETEGYYDKVLSLMAKDGSPEIWMLQSEVLVHTDSITGKFIINFWNDGKVVIDEILRPPLLNIPNDDFLELKDWLLEHGWEIPQPANKLIESAHAFSFWEHQYRSGLINCSVIDDRENDLLDKIRDSEDQENSKC